MVFKCKSCSKDFSSKHGLNQHNADKHATGKKTPPKLKLNKKWVYIGVTVFIILGIIKLTPNNSTSFVVDTNKIPNGPIHWHPELSIEINGETQAIPANIGISAGGHAPLHTHNYDGVLHLENNYPNAKTLSLGYFFELWNKEFNESCIFNFCTNETHEMKMYVNGNEVFDYKNYIMQPEDKILIKYAQKEQSEVNEFKMTAEQFEFIPNTINVNQGDTVRLIITSTDVAHGIGLPDFGVSAELLPGETTTVEFVADKTGTFDFVCSVYCGVGHNEMKGTIIVE